MSWAFWRADGAAAQGAERAVDGTADGTADDPAVALHVRTRRRLIGAAVLLLAAVIVLPLILDSAPRTIPETVAIDIPGDKTPFTPKLVPRPTTTTETVAAKDAAPADELAAVAAPVATASAVPATPAAGMTEPRPAPAAMPAPAPASKTEEAAARPQAVVFVLQVAAVASEESARKLVGRLKAGGYPVYTEKVDTTKGERTRVRVGPYKTREAAEKAHARLVKDGFNAKWVG